ncbi:hypothetical protein HMPREF0091_10810 [Fannyhessea vaginae DSM 15829]|uniref:Uncharacterized protein n=1 Tax=Fannyhessea vaginae DSM 15829 TaxID=525256 RepID=F1T5D2_9ACTN|nr:hypothetical protein HMPREF0091_10810 [Fannyhessea vaginae DSM 15829]
MPCEKRIKLHSNIPYKLALTHAYTSINLPNFQRIYGHIAAQ